MRTASTRRIILDSSSEPDTDNLSNRSHRIALASAATPPARNPAENEGPAERSEFEFEPLPNSKLETRRTLNPRYDATPTSNAASHTSTNAAVDGDEGSEPDSDARPKKKAGRKPRPHLPVAPQAAEAGEQKGKSKRISWGAYPMQTAFLDSALDNILMANKPQRRALKKRAKKDFTKKWPTFGQYTREEVEKGIDNWFKNHTQFPHLRNPSTTATTAEEPEGTEDDDDGPSFPASTHPASVPTASNPNSIALAPLLKSIRRRARGPSGWWALEHREEVKALQTKLGGNIGALRTAVHKLYNRLSNDEKAIWEEKATDEKEKQSQDEKQCFRNQDDFPLLVATLLGSFIGYDPQQVGSAIIYFRMAMRTETRAIQHDQYTVGLSDDDDSFDMFAGGPKQDEIDRWANYVDAILPENPVQRDERLTYDVDGLPKLPPYDDEWTVAQARSALEVWFQAMWIYGLEKSVELPNGLDWSNFANTVAPYVPSAWADRVNSKPSDRPFHLVVTLYHELFEAQATPNAFRWTASAPSNPIKSISLNRALPHTPSKATYITYTTPIKTSTPHSQTHISSTHKLPRLVFPTVDALADGYEIVPRSSSPDPQAVAKHDDRSRSIVVETASPVRAVVARASLNTNDNVSSTIHDTWATPFGDTGVAIAQDTETASQVAAELVMTCAASTLLGTDSAFGDTGLASAMDSAPSRRAGVDQDSSTADGTLGTSHARVADTDDTSSPTAHSNVRLDDTHARVDGLGGHDATTGTPTHPATGKRKRESRSLVPSSKRSKIPTGEKKLESVTPPTGRAARPQPPPPRSPRRTRGAVEREAREAAAREALANTAQT